MFRNRKNKSVVRENIIKKLIIQRQLSLLKILESRDLYLGKELRYQANGGFYARELNLDLI